MDKEDRDGFQMPGVLMTMPKNWQELGTVNNQYLESQDDILFLDLCFGIIICVIDDSGVVTRPARFFLMFDLLKKPIR